MFKTTKNSCLFLATVLLTGIFAIISPSFNDVEASGDKHKDNQYDKSKSVIVKEVVCNQNNINVGGVSINLQPGDIVSTLAGAQAQDESNQELSANSMGNSERNQGERNQGYNKHDNKDIVFVCINNNNGGNIPPPPSLENATLSINKQWFICNDDDIDCTVRSESDITFDTPSSGNYTACTEQDDNCPFVADTGLNIQISGNSPTPNTIPALIGTQAPVDIGSGPFDVTESFSNESQSLFDQLLISVQTGPVGLAYDPINERMYVPNQFSNTVSVISTATNMVVGTPIPVGANPIDIAYDPVNERMYVANLGGNTVSVISTATNTVIGSPIPVGSRPASIAYDPVNERMYVTNFNFGGSGTVSVISTATNMVVGSPIPVGDGSRDIAYDPVNERMYVTNFGSGSGSTVSVISTATNMVVGSPIPAVPSPSEIAYDPVNERMYVTNRGGTTSDTVTAISTATNMVVGTPIPAGTTVASIAYDPVNERMYVTNLGDPGTVSVISTATNMVVGSPIPVGNSPQGIAYDPVNERMYVTNWSGASVSVLYLSANKVCQDSGFDAGELRTYDSNEQMIEQITCVNFVGDCSGNIQGGEANECTVQDYAVRVNDISDTPTILTPFNQDIDQQQVQQEMEDE